MSGAATPYSPVYTRLPSDLDLGPAVSGSPGGFRYAGATTTAVFVVDDRRPPSDSAAAASIGGSGGSRSPVTRSHSTFSRASSRGIHLATAASTVAAAAAARSLTLLAGRADKTVSPVVRRQRRRKRKHEPGGDGDADAEAAGAGTRVRWPRSGWSSREADRDSVQLQRLLVCSRSRPRKRAVRRCGRIAVME
jgi:hypothetical protein